jgi:tetratricopeptide (TPR) repeat protein
MANQSKWEKVKYSKVILILFFCLIFVSTPTKAQDARSYYEDGYQYFSQGDYKKAEESYQRAIELDPNFEDAHYWLGKVYRQLGEYNKAVPQWIEVLKLNPRNPYAFRYLNESFRGTPQVQSGDANEYLKKGIEILEITDDAFLNRNQYSNLTLLQVVPYFKKAIELKEDLIASHYWLAEVYYALSEKITWQYTSMAINSFERAIQVLEENPDLSQKPSEYWYSYQELITIFQSLGLNERRDNLLKKIQEVKTKPYREILNKAGYENYGYPDRIEIIRTNGEVIELWEYVQQEKTFRVVDKEIVGEEIYYNQHPHDTNLIEEYIEEEVVDDEGEL